MLHIVVALHCEAKAIIHQYHLKKISDQSLSFPVFSNKEQSIFLIISGVGKVKSAIATTFLFPWAERQPYPCYLNVGVAGAKALKIGDMYRVSKIMEHSSNRVWYPFIPDTQPVASVITYDVPQTQYPLNSMVDMEASGFYQAANQFVSREHIQLLKIISDNDGTSPSELTAESVHQLIQYRMSNLVQHIDALLKLSQSETEHHAMCYDPNPFFQRWHFTYSQSMQLRRLLHRWFIQFQNDEAYSFCQSELSATHVIQTLQKKLDDYADYLY